MPLLSDLKSSSGGHYLYDLLDVPGGGSASGAGTTATASAPQGIATGFALVTMVAPFTFGPESIFYPNRFTGVPANGDTVRYPTNGGFVVNPDGTVESDGFGTWDCFYNDGGGEVAFAVTIDGNAYAFGQGVTATATPPEGTAQSEQPGDATGSGTTATASAPTATATGAAAATGDGTMSGSVPGDGAAQGAAQIDAGGVTTTASPAEGAAEGMAAASGAGTTADAQAPSGEATGADGSLAEGSTATAAAPEGTASGGASVDAEGAITTISGGDIRGVAAEIVSSIYARRQDMINRFGETEILQLTDRNNLGEIDESVLSHALQDADGEIDPYLQGRYQLPLPSVPRVLRRIACDIARYHLYEDRVTESVAKRYDRALKFLRELAERKVTLGFPATSSSDNAAPAGGPSADGAERVFTRDSLDDFL